MKLYKEPLGTLKAYREIESNETIVHYCRNLYLILHPFVPLEHFCVLPKLAIVRWRIEVVKAQVGDLVSPIRRCADRGCSIVIFDFILIEISFPFQ